MDDTPAWGIEPVPPRLRVLGLLDQGLLWSNLGVSLLVLVAGTYLVPALSLPEAFLAIVIGGLIGNTMLGAAAMIGADARVPAMVLMRAPLGQRGSWAPTVLNAAQCIGWAIFELLIIATAVAALSDELFGFRAQWLWTILFGGVALALALLGPIGFVRKFVRKFAVWAVLASLLYLTWWALDGSGFGSLWDREGDGGFALLDGVDLVVAITVSWVPLAADYSRFARDRSSAFWGTAAGYFVAGTWLWLLGAILFFSRDITDPAALPVAVAAGGLGAVLALLAVTVDETDEAFANAYSAAVSVQNLAPARAAAAARRRRLRRGDGRRADDRPPLLRELPAHARVVLRAALRRPAGGLARRRLALRRTRRLLRPGRALGDARRLDRRVRALPVAASGRPLVVDGRARRGRRSRHRRDVAELRGRVRARAGGRDAGRAPLLEFARYARRCGDRESREGHGRRRPSPRRRCAFPRRAGAATARR